MNKYTLDQKTGVLLINLGTPDHPTYFSVMRFLREFLSDNKVIRLPKLLWYPLLYGFILPFRSRATSKKYRAIWTNEGSPLLLHSIHQVNLLKEKLDPMKFQVELGMRYGNPRLQDALQKLNSPHINKIIVIPLFPQYSSSTTGTCFKAVTKTLSKWMYIPEIHFIHQFCSNDNYIQAMTDQISSHPDFNSKNYTLFSYHGLPSSFLDEGDPYYCFCCKTTRLITEKLKIDKDKFETCFQSRFGYNSWLKPYATERITALAKSGYKNINIVCPSFVSDCLETNEEIALELKQLFMKNGGEQFNVIRSLNQHEKFIGMLKKYTEK
ncbi:MAG TPA: ferrochelatase [Gammaproteobacteria bacterium]|nr:ferrochelatase [Gammaproteobacteria bacterium]